MLLSRLSLIRREIIVMNFLTYGRIARDATRALSGGMDIPLKLPKPRATKPITLVLVAAGVGGYVNSYDEVQDAINGVWNPSSLDFFTAARQIKRPDVKIAGVRKAADFFAAMRSSAAKIKRLVFLGYDDMNYLGLSARRQRLSPQMAALFGLPAIALTHTHKLDKNSFKKAKASLPIIRRRFEKNAEFDVVTHSCSLDKSFIQFLADTFGMTVRSFSYGPKWHLDYSVHSRAVTGRGKFKVPQPWQIGFPQGYQYITGAHNLYYDLVVQPQKTTVTAKP